MMYCGIDIIEVKRIKDAIENNILFLNKVYTINEINEIEKCKNKYERYAGRFAAKEAIYKGISEILNDNNISIEFNEIEILNGKNRRPIVNILKDIPKLKIDVSISHIEKTAIANCIVISNE